MNNRQQKEINQQCLYLALMELLKQKPIEKITIGELCDTAGVSRMTFYRSYNYKEDILLQHLEECFESYMQEVQLQNYYEVALSFFRFWENREKDFLYAVVKSGLSSQLIDRFYVYLDQIIPSMVSENVPPFVRSFLAGGLYRMLMDWMKEGAKTTPEEMAAFLAKGSYALTKL